MRLSPLEPWINRKIVSTDIQAWQLARINDTLAWVRSRSPFYRKQLGEFPESIPCLEELYRFPFTTPDDLRLNPLRFVCVSQDEIRRVVTLQSSGTTGEPKRIFFTADDQQLTIDFFGAGMSSLTEAGERVLILLPGETPGSVGDLLKSGLERWERIPIPYGPVRDPWHALAAIQKNRIDCLVGSPVQVLGLARRWNADHRAPRTVLLSTDYVPTAIVNELEYRWGCKVFNHYGSTEMGLGGGVECEAHSGYHLREADLLFEIVNEKTGEPVPDGEYGEVVFSTLTRRGMPLIRYRTGDRSRFITGQCPCGTRLRTLEKISARFSELFTVGDKTIQLADFDEALFTLPELLDFSVTLKGDRASTTIVVETQMLTQEDATILIREKLGRISSIQDVPVEIHCRFNPAEIGGLLKRNITDKRNQ